MTELLSINQAAARGISRLRRSIWANPADHIKIDIIESEAGPTAGPWLHLYSPLNEEMNGRNPVDFLEFRGRDEECFEPFSEPGEPAP